MANQKKLHENRTSSRSALDQRGAAREGHALLQGLVLCGRCGHRMNTQYCGNRRRAVYQCYSNIGTGLCWSVPARAIDQAVVALFLDVVKPPEIELALAVVREAERQGSEVDRQWTLRLERARYEAQLAERRYKAIDPDHRVVARTLEREWNDKLTELERLEGEYRTVRQREKIDLTEEDRVRILALAKDLPMVWNAATTTHAERKNLLRMLVREVTASPVEVPVRASRVRLLWQTGAVSAFSVPRKDKYTAQATPKDTLALLRDLYMTKRKGDGEIAAELNRRGRYTGLNRFWTVAAVRRIRYDVGVYRLSPKAHRPPDRRADGLYSVHAVAAEIDVKPGAVRYWARTGVLEPVVHGGPGRPHWFKLDGATVTRLRAYAAQCARRRVTGAGDRSLGPQQAEPPTPSPDVLRGYPAQPQPRQTRQPTRQ
jgi:hypothetical protein